MNNRAVVLWPPTRTYPFCLNWWGYELKVIRLPNYLDDLPVLVTPYGQVPIIEYWSDKNRQYFRILWMWFSFTYDTDWRNYR